MQSSRSVKSAFIDLSIAADHARIEARALCFLKEIERRFFDAESTDADASIDRGARKRSKTVEENHSDWYMFTY